MQGSTAKAQSPRVHVFGIGPQGSYEKGMVRFDSDEHTCASHSGKVFQTAEVSHSARLRSLFLLSLYRMFPPRRLRITGEHPFEHTGVPLNLSPKDRIGEKLRFVFALCRKAGGPPAASEVLPDGEIAYATVEVPYTGRRWLLTHASE